MTDWVDQARDRQSRLLSAVLHRNLVKTFCMEGHLDDQTGLQQVVRDIAATLSDDLDGVLELDLMPFGNSQPAMTVVMGHARTVRRRSQSAG